MTSKKNQNKKNDQKLTANSSRKKLVDYASKIGIDANIIASFDTNDIDKKAFFEIISKFESLPSKDSQKVDKVDKPKKEMPKNILGGAIKNSRCKSDYVIIFTLKSGDKITQKVGFGGFKADKTNEKSLGTIINNGSGIVKKMLKSLSNITDILYNVTDNHLYFFTNGAYGVDKDTLLNEQNGFWLTNLATIPQDFISCEITKK